ncbi:uncharacterized protein LTR77_008588 [Saxophila tyrrhenica]|uniref:Alpha-L-rhamnosidase n=1 Tax=Saxophila tyrrhenica TaxID=1690608 RepID=A0AAV9P1E8_9PEZI|nr:hypothetical protein LTR77_008588 [Saxophila tyrrhenica]
MREDDMPDRLSNFPTGIQPHHSSWHNETMISLRLSLLVFTAISFSVASPCWQGVACTGPTKAAFPGPWEKNIFSPSSRNVEPQQSFPLEDIHKATSYPSPQNLHKNASAVVYDFGKAVGGIATIKYSTTGDAGRLGLAFSEAKDWIGLASDSSNGPFAHGVGDQACGDGAIYDSFSSSGQHSFTMELQHLRGSFRYLTAFLLTNGTTSLSISAVEVEIAFAPTWPNLQAYQGYFHCSDDELNRIWLAGAYTLQTNIAPSDCGRWWDPPIETGWANNATLSNGSSAIVDGAKRDRTIWPGDMGVAVGAAFYSLGDLESVVNALNGVYDLQAPTGELPRAALPLISTGGDAYHCWGMIGVYNYVLYTDDLAFLNRRWKGYQKAMEYIYAKVFPESGLLNVTGTGDWARLNSYGTYSEANVILHRTLTTAAELAGWMGDVDLQTTYAKRATQLKRNILHHFYDDSYGAFRDNLTSTSVYPQDANSMAIALGLLSPTSERSSSVSERLTGNWTPFGAETPELPNNISPFISSFEIQAHFLAGAPDRALELIRRSWGWYLANPNGTESTLIEGYLTNGSFGYRNYQGYEWDSSYTSHAHGWSTGPTSALTEYVLGLSVTGRAGSEWRLAPQFGDLNFAEGGFTTGLGKFSAKWRVRDDGYELEWCVPKGTKGVVLLPGLQAGSDAVVTMNGKKTEVPDHKIRLGGGKKNRLVVKRVM